MADPALYDLAPLGRLALVGVALAAGPLAWIWLRHRGAAPGRRLHALAALTLFLTFDLVLFGAYTRLSDSGLGCPDWPGCYGHASPIGAQEHIGAAQAVQPSGPVTHRKAWVEMVHRYLATAVGVLLCVIAAARWLAHRRGEPGGALRWWATAALAWVCVQGAFGALTVTMKLYPAIVTAHLLGGMALLALLAAQVALSGTGGEAPILLSPPLRLGLWAVCALALLQIALGGWVSTNYAVLACSDFPTCQGRWWPPMDWQGFDLKRELGRDGSGGWLPFAALTAIHYAHRLMAAVVLAALALLAWRLAADGRSPLRRAALALGTIAAWQLASGVSNVVLGWPIAAAVAHTAGAAALVMALTGLVARTRAAGFRGATLSLRSAS